MPQLNDKIEKLSTEKKELKCQLSQAHEALESLSSQTDKDTEIVENKTQLNEI